MNSDHEKFETLRKLMALKRHEQPPSEYLHELHDRIITRIEHGEGRQNMWDRLAARFSLRPGLAYAFGLTVCGALGLSVGYMVREEMTKAADSSPEAALRGPVSEGAFASQIKPPAPPMRVANWLVNTNPSADPQLELSLSATGHAAVPVSYEYEQAH